MCYRASKSANRQILSFLSNFSQNQGAHLKKSSPHEPEQIGTQTKLQYEAAIMKILKMYNQYCSSYTEFYI